MEDPRGFTTAGLFTQIGQDLTHARRHMGTTANEWKERKRANLVELKRRFAGTELAATEAEALVDAFRELGTPGFATALTALTALTIPTIPTAPAALKNIVEWKEFAYSARHLADRTNAITFDEALAIIKAWADDDTRAPGYTYTSERKAHLNTQAKLVDALRAAEASGETAAALRVALDNAGPKREAPTNFVRKEIVAQIDANQVAELAHARAESSKAVDLAASLDRRFTDESRKRHAAEATAKAVAAELTEAKRSIESDWHCGQCGANIADTAKGIEDLRDKLAAAILAPNSVILMEMPDKFLTMATAQKLWNAEKDQPREHLLAELAGWHEAAAPLECETPESLARTVADLLRRARLTTKKAADLLERLGGPESPRIMLGNRPGYFCGPNESARAKAMIRSGEATPAATNTPEVMAAAHAQLDRMMDAPPATCPQCGRHHDSPSNGYCAVCQHGIARHEGDQDAETTTAPAIDADPAVQAAGELEAKVRKALLPYIGQPLTAATWDQMTAVAKSKVVNTMARHITLSDLPRAIVVADNIGDGTVRVILRGGGQAWRELAKRAGLELDQ